MSLSRLLSSLSFGHYRIPNRLIAAPMAGISDPPFRTILKSCGAGLTFSEMVSAEAYVRGHRKTLGILERSELEYPFGIQIFGGNPETLIKAAKQLEQEGRCEIIDINLGCPVRKVIRSGAGVALMLDRERLFRAVEGVLGSVSLPVTVKIRACKTPDDLTGLDLIPELLSRGIGAIFLHARCTSWNFSHQPKWDWIKMAVESGRTVIGNGGIFTPEGAIEMVVQTGCDGVMIARGYQGNPWIFRETLQFVKEGKVTPVTLEEKFETMKWHLSLSVETFGARNGILKMRKHLSWYVKGLPLNSNFRDRINKINDYEDVLKEIDRYYNWLIQHSGD